MEKLSLSSSIQIKASALNVWDVLTNPEEIKKYLFGTETITDWKEGNPIKFKGIWEGKNYEDHGTILKIDNAKILQYSYWSSFSGRPDVLENYLIVTFELKKVKNKTILTLTNSNFSDEKSMEHSKQNWDTVLKKIKEIAESKT